MTDFTAVANELFSQFDADHDGTLNREELKAFYDGLVANRADLGLSADGYDAWYSTIDKDGDGTVNVAELANYLQSINYSA
jgi:Ca2+-binding EF-hand superfamily protein